MSTILCVSENLDWRDWVMSILSQAGFKAVQAHDAKGGLTLARCSQSSLVLLDMEDNPEEGLLFLKEMRAAEESWGCLPVVCCMDRERISAQLTAYAAGADDCMDCNIEQPLFLAKIRSHLARRQRVITQAQRQQEHLSKELVKAHTMQRRLLPSRETERVMERAYNIRLSSHYESSEQLGGDIWGVSLLSETQMILYLVDFSGHGISSAMNTFRLHSRIDNEPIGLDQPVENYMANLNEWLCEHLATGQYATMLMGVCDFEEETFAYAAAGATAPVRVSGDDGTIEVGSGKGVPLGMSKKSTYERRTLPFKPGDSIFLYSDALIEHGRKEKLDIGRDGVVRLLEQVQLMGNEMVVNEILAPFMALAPRPLSDDLTAVCCTWKS